MVTLRTVRLHGEQRDFTWEARAHRGQRDRAAYGETVLRTSSQTALQTANLYCGLQMHHEVMSRRMSSLLLLIYLKLRVLPIK